jgi:hypothetical protein
MSRWAGAFRASKVSTESIVSRPRPPSVAEAATHSVNTVHSVTPPRTIDFGRGMDAAADLRRAANGALIQPLVERSPSADDPAALMRRAAKLRAMQDPTLARPPAWPGIDNPPTTGCWCSCCRGNLWWSEAVDPRGWRCCACHPAPGHQSQTVEITT